MRYLKDAFKKNLLSGVLILIPIALTIWIFTNIVFGLDQLVQPFMDILFNKFWTGKDLIDFNIPGFGFVVTLVLTLIVGMVGRNFFGQFFLKSAERILAKIPIIPKVYDGIKQVLNTFIGNDKSNYNGVALVEYPRRGLWTIALITGKPHQIFSDNIEGCSEDDLVSLYVPTTPNPTSGFYLVSNKKDIRPLNISTEKAFKIILSCGIVGDNDTQVVKKEIANEKS